MDRKIRIVNENTSDYDDWIKWTIRAFEVSYGYEYQGDNLLIARVNLLLTFVDYYRERWEKDPDEKLLRQVTNIIAWNIWQMDGLKDTVPLGKPYEEFHQMSLFEQAGHEKAEYGSETLNMLSKDLTNQYGAGFSRSNISRMRQLYLAYPKCATLSHKLSWSHQLMTDDIRHKLYDLKNCDINFAENEIFTSERIKLLRDIIDRQIDAVFRPFWHYTPMGVQCG